MWKPVHHSVASLWVGLGLAVVLLLLCSCDEVERHNVLTLFFDGVPPLPGEVNEPVSPSLNAVEAANGFQTGGWHVHKPLSNCTDCHGSRQRQNFSRQVRLVAEVPKLCYGCHQGYSDLKGWVHGPVATGECLLCHEPHKSRNEFLLVKSVPELCYGCHDPQAIRQIDRHADESYTHCNDCHEGHAGAARNLLKPALLKGLPGMAPPPEVRAASEAPRSATAPQKTGEESEQPQMTPADRYNRSVQAYHAGRFAEAREGFLEVLGSGSAPESMRKMAKDYLEKIEWLQNESKLPGWQPAQ